MKKKHIVVLAATYAPFARTADLERGLVPIEAPKNYVDPVKKEHYIREENARRDGVLATLWPLKTFESLRVCYYDGSPGEPQVVLFESIGPDTDIAGALAPIASALEAAVEADETIQFVGVGVRDILRILRTRYADAGLVPYPWISEQRNVIDPVGMLDTEKINKHLDPLYVLRQSGIAMPDDYRPGQSSIDDCNVAIRSYNALCRTRSQPELAL